jgi:hypothetical protein
MMKLRKSRLTLAVGATLGAAALMPASSFGWSVDTIHGVLDSASGGDTLLFPLYSTVDPVATSFSTTNTGSQTIVAKIRFREQEHSMDVLDFLVIYSPYDKFDFAVTKLEGDERPSMVWNDNSCVVGPGSAQVQFPAPSQFVSSNEAMAVGHLEVLGMATIDNAWVKGDQVVLSTESGAVSLAAAAKHGDDGVPANCSLLTTWFGNPSLVYKLNTSPYASLGDVGNYLMGRYVVTGQGLGIEAGSDAISIRDSNLGMPYKYITAQSGALCSSGGNCTKKYAWDGAEWDHPHLGEMANLSNFQSALTAANVAGDWSNNPANDVGLDWILSFPNKYAYLDLVGSDWWLLAETKTGYGMPYVWTQENTKDTCLNDNSLIVLDTEEQMASGNVSVSPGTRTTLDICHELQVFTLAPLGQDVRPSVIQTEERRGVITFENLDGIRGWGAMGLNWNYTGDSITGGIFTTRNTDDPTINNASLTDLQKGISY